MENLNKKMNEIMKINSKVISDIKKADSPIACIRIANVAYYKVQGLGYSGTIDAYTDIISQTLIENN